MHILIHMGEETIEVRPYNRKTHKVILTLDSVDDIIPNKKEVVHKHRRQHFLFGYREVRFVVFLIKNLSVVNWL